ncbi:MAG: hypothetical protein ABIL05_03930 [candidate division WOR-3 bacterium]
MKRATDLLDTAETVFSGGNFIFLGLMVVSFIVTWIISLLFVIVERYLEDRWPPSKKILSIITQPILMLILVTGYALAQTFLVLPIRLYEPFGQASQFLTYLTFSWFLINLLTVLISSLTPKGARFIHYLLIIIFLFLVSLIFINRWLVLLIGGILAVIFYLLVYKISSLPAPSFVQLADEKKVYPRLIQMHIYLNLKTTGEKIEQALGLIKEAIGEVSGTGEEKNVIFNGFASDGLDIMVKYYIVDIPHLDQIKNDVNLRIVKKLNEAGVQLGSIG